MKERFERFVTTITQIYKSLQKLKSQAMADFGLKGTHVMCLYQLQQNPEGLTVTQLAKICEEDKAAISRSLAELRSQDLVQCPEETFKRYRAAYTLTRRGLQVSAGMDQKIDDAVMKGAQGYSEEDRHIFYDVLLRVAENLQLASGETEDMK